MVGFSIIKSIRKKKKKLEEGLQRGNQPRGKGFKLSRNPPWKLCNKFLKIPDACCNF